MQANATAEDFTDWVGSSEVRRDTVTAAPLMALSALLDRDDPEPREGDAAPPLAHWLYFLPTYRQSDAGPDGHAARGGFMPPITLSRRMWAGSRLEFVKPLRVGAQVERLSRITSVVPKEGRSGALVFVTVRHEVRDAAGMVLTDEHDVVYREDKGKAVADPVPAPTGEQWCREIRPDPVLLFRYSAVTFNSHRIHYDYRYVTQVEGYPGLVVHGPLIATLLIDLLRRNAPSVQVKTYRFRALRPLFDTASFWTLGVPDAANLAAKLWTRDAEGAVNMEAEATYAR